MEEKNYMNLTPQEMAALLMEKDAQIESLRKALEKAKFAKSEQYRLQSEGIRQAKEKGVRFGRPRKKIPKEFYRYRRQYHEKKLTLEEAARKSHCSVGTFRKWDRETGERLQENDKMETEA